MESPIPLPTAPSNRLIGLCGPDTESRAELMRELAHSHRYRPVSARICIAAQACMRWHVPLNTFIDVEAHEEPQDKLALARCDHETFVLHVQAQRLGINLQAPRTPAEIMHRWRRYRGEIYWNALIHSRVHLLLQPPKASIVLDASTTELQELAAQNGELWHVGHGYTPLANFHVQRVGNAWMCSLMPQEAVAL